MGLKEYLSGDLKATIIYFVLGIVAGYAAFVINNPRLALVSMMVILGLSTAVMKYALKAPNYKWFLSNGIIVFLFMWFVVWTIFYNFAAAV